MKTINISIYLIMMCLAFAAKAKPVVCESEDKKVTAQLDIEGPLLYSSTINTCIKADESVPGCNEYGSYTCPCLEYEKPRQIEYYYWKVSGKIRTQNEDLQLTRFTMLQNGSIFTGTSTMYSNNYFNSPWYKLTVSKEIAENAPFVAEIGLYPNREYPPRGDDLKAICKY